MDIKIIQITENLLNFGWRKKCGTCGELQTRRAGSSKFRTCISADRTSSLWR